MNERDPESSMRKPLLAIAAAACILVALIWTQSGTSVDRSLTSEPQYTAGGSETCRECHGSEKDKLLAARAHGDPNILHSPYAEKGCESCHGPASLHVSRARGGAGFPALLSFGDRNTRPEQTAACLNCHANDMGKRKGIDWPGSPHDTPRMTCVSCHRIHAAEDAVSNRDGQLTVCARCHRKTVAEHRESVRRFDRLKCSACHKVHRAGN